MIAPFIAIAAAIVGSAAAKNKSDKSFTGGSGSPDTAPVQPPVPAWIPPKGLIQATGETVNTLKSFSVNTKILSKESLQFLIENHYVSEALADQWAAANNVSILGDITKNNYSIPAGTLSIDADLKTFAYSKNGQSFLVNLLDSSIIDLREFREALGMPFFINAVVSRWQPAYKIALSDFKAGRITVQDFANRIMVVDDAETPEMAKEKTLVQAAIYDRIGTMKLTSQKNPDGTKTWVKVWTPSAWMMARKEKFQTKEAAKKAIFTQAHLDIQGETEYVTPDKFDYPLVDTLVKKIGKASDTNQSTINPE